jgi:hypothetical protein
MYAYETQIGCPFQDLPGEGVIPLVFKGDLLVELTPGEFFRRFPDCSLFIVQLEIHYRCCSPQIALALTNIRAEGPTAFSPAISQQSPPYHEQSIEDKV